MRALVRWVGRLLAVIVATTLAVVTAAVWLSLPGGDLTQAIPNLTAPVDITLDTDGIPRITAATEGDAAAALGFLHARERLFQMDLMRRAARGELSELVGPAALRLDRFGRTLNLRDRAEADLATLAPPTRQVLDRYTQGVNAWIARRRRFAALEFTLLGEPRPWTAADSLLWGKTMGLYLSGNWPVELARLSLADHLTHEQIQALWPAQTTLPPYAANTPVSPTLATTATRLAEALPRFPDRFTLPNSASNEWAVDGAHSATGAPLLAGDPHLAFGLPAIWYLARIDTPTGSLVGATAPGVPFLAIGHNGRIAWTFTTTGADTQDLFLEQPAASGYQTEAGPRPFITRSETIHIRGAPDEILQVRETRHGPIISDLIGDKTHLIALSIASLAPGDTAAEGLLALNHAQTVAEAGLAAARISSPIQNLLVADRAGIGQFTTGRIPVRRAGDGAFPAPGENADHDWTGWAQGAALPHSTAPTSGRLVNANEQVATPDSTALISHDWFGDTRARRIRTMLDAHPKATPADFAAMQVDDLDLVALSLLPRLRPMEPLLGPWDGRMQTEAAAPLIFNAWMIDFADTLLQSLDVPPAAAAAAAPWPDLVRAALSPESPLCAAACDRMLQASHDRAMKSLSTRFGPDPTRWHWGDAHEAVFRAPALRGIPILGEALAARTPAIGSDSTVGRGGVRPGSLEAVHGAAYRGIYDLADLERSLFAIAPGQSGNPLSQLSRNFLARWQQGTTIAIRRAPDAVATTLHLTP